MHIIDTLPLLKSQQLDNYDFGAPEFFKILNDDLEDFNLNQDQIEKIKAHLKAIFNSINLFYKREISPITRGRYQSSTSSSSENKISYFKNIHTESYWVFSKFKKFYRDILINEIIELDEYILSLNKDLDFHYSAQQVFNFYTENIFFDTQDTSKNILLTTPVPKQWTWHNITNYAPFSLFVSNFIQNFLDIYYNFTSLYELDVKFENKKVFSTLHSNFLNNFKIDQLPVVTSLNYTPQVMDRTTIPFKNVSTLHRNDLKRFFASETNPQISISNNNPVFYNTQNQSNKPYVSSFTSVNSENLDYLFDLDLNEFQIYHIPYWESKSNAQPTFKVVNRNFLKRRKGAFIPVLIENQAFLNAHSSSEKVYNLVIINITNKQYTFQTNFAYYSLMAKAFAEFITYYNFKDAIYFKDRKQYIELIQEQYKHNYIYNALLNKEFNINKVKDYIQKYNQIFDSTESNLFKFDNSKIFKEETITTISSSYKKDSFLERKKIKLNLKFQKLKQNIKTFQKRSTSIASYLDKNDALLINTLLTKKHLIELKNSSFNATSLNNYFKLSNISKDLNSKIIEDKKNKIKNKDFVIDPFLFNLRENNIHLLSVSYLNKQNQSITISELSNELTGFEKQDNIASYEEIEFLIDKPVQIFVDSKEKPKAVKIGGPYIVKVTKDSLRIKLKDKNSFFAFIDNRYLVHPHVSSGYQLNNQYYNACLGDASPLIYNAFKQNNLKLIILSAMTWVCSANSTDTWGKRYKAFLDYDLFNIDILSSKEVLTSSETDQIISTLNDNLTKEESQQEQLTETPIQQTFSEEEFTSTPETYTSYYRS